MGKVRIKFIQSTSYPPTPDFRFNEIVNEIRLEKASFKIE